MGIKHMQPMKRKNFDKVGTGKSGLVTEARIMRSVSERFLKIRSCGNIIDATNSLYFRIKFCSEISISCD